MAATAATTKKKRSQSSEASTSSSSFSSIRGGSALLSGIAGATASCFAKLAFSSWENDDDSSASWFDGTGVSFLLVRNVCGGGGTFDNNDNGRTTAAYYYYHYCRLALLQLLPRGLCLAAMILCNAVMLACFLRGLRESGSVAGTALSSASNFITSALLGSVLWNETFGGRWGWIGFAMVVSGTVLLSTVGSSSTTNTVREPPPDEQKQQRREEEKEVETQQAEKKKKN